MFDARLHPHTLADADLETLREFGVTGALVVCRAAETIDDVRTSWDDALKQRTRLERFGVDAFVALSIPCRAVTARGLSAALRALPEALGQPRVAALGPLMLSRGSADEQRVLSDQLALAHEFARPVLLTAPAARHEAMVAKTLALVKRAALEPSQVAFDGLGLKSVRSALARGHFAGLTLHPDRLEVDLAERMIHALGPERLVLGSGAGEGPSDLLALPRLVSRLKREKLSAGVVKRVSERNARAWLHVS